VTSDRNECDSQRKPAHYHLNLYHSGRLLQELARASDRQAAVSHARELTSKVQDQMGASTYRVRVEPCTLVHFPSNRHPQ
jgi:hypothetical protein